MNFAAQKKMFIYVETIWRLSYVPCNTCVAGSGNTFLFETTTVSCFCELVFLFPTNCCLWKTVNVFSQDAVFHVKEICCPHPTRCSQPLIYVPPARITNNSVFHQHVYHLAH